MASDWLVLTLTVVWSSECSEFGILVLGMFRPCNADPRNSWCSECFVLGMYVRCRAVFSSLSYSTGLLLIIDRGSRTRRPAYVLNGILTAEGEFH